MSEPLMLSVALLVLYLFLFLMMITMTPIDRWTFASEYFTNLYIFTIHS